MYRIGIDLGGTNIAVGIVNEKFEIVSKASVKTGLPCCAESIADKIAITTKQAAETAGINISDVVSVGVGTPGLVDPEEGIVKYASNLRFDHVPLAKLVGERLGVAKVYVQNDANAAAYGEFIAGSGKNTKNFIAVTLGTGVGGGIIINGKLYAGSNNAGAELGHMIVDADGEMCSCGMQGCWEAYSSATALVSWTKEAMRKDTNSIMWELCKGDIENADGKTSFDGMRAGDTAATEVVNKYIKYLSVGIASLVTMFQPDVIALGGGVSAEGDTLLDPIRERLEKNACTRGATLKIAELGNDAGIIGAAFLE